MKRKTLVITLGILLGTAIIATSAGIYQSYLITSYDKLAASDYRKLRAAVFNAIADRKAPRRFFFVGYKGPYLYPTPLQGIQLSQDIHATVLHETKRRLKNRPKTITRIEVSHAFGRARYILTELDGLVVEQLVAKGA